LISSPGRGRFVATEEGRRLLSRNPPQINVSLLQEYPAFREFYKASNDQTPESVAPLSEKKLEITPTMGYGGSRKNAATQLGRSGDGGVDGVINEDRLGLDCVFVQAKRYAKETPVGRPEVQAFVGSLVGLGATKGVFVTTSTFSGHARQFVQHLSQRVILIDGEALADLMIEHGVGVRTFRAIEFRRLGRGLLL
jgi:restriction system protein